MVWTAKGVRGPHLEDTTHSWIEEGVDKGWGRVSVVHGFEGPIEGHIFANHNEKIIEGYRGPAAITRNHAADV